MDRLRTAAAVGLIALGLGAPLADLAGAPEARRLLEATSASPLPGGPLRRATDFAVPGTRLFLLFADGRPALELDAARLDGLRGPARRRALFRLALARGPELEADPSRREGFRALVAHAFAPGSSVRAELGLEPLAPIRYLQYQTAHSAEGERTLLIEVEAR